MIAWLKTLDLDIESTAEDQGVHDRLPEIVADDVVLGTLNPYLRKFLCVIEKRQDLLHKTAQELQALPMAAQELRLGEIARLNEEIVALTKIFWIETADDISRTSGSSMWSKDLFFNVKKGWLVTGVAPEVMMRGQGNPVVFVAIGNPEDAGLSGDDFGDSTELPDDPPPPKKRNRRLDS